MAPDEYASCADRHWRQRAYVRLSTSTSMFFSVAQVIRVLERRTQQLFDVGATRFLVNIRVLSASSTAVP